MPIPLTGQPLDELKQWLAITTAREDALLLRLLETAEAMCREFTATPLADWPAEWALLAPMLRQGIIRFAAHQYRQRDSGEAAAPPAAIAALWRPHRRVLL